MKANEAPEKIYMPNELLSEEWQRHIEGEDTEYVRADAFINKACSGIDQLLSGYIIRNFHFGDSYEIDKLIEDFKDYIKEE